MVLWGFGVVWWRFWDGSGCFNGPPTMGASLSVPLSKRPLVKTSPNWSKRPVNTKKDGSKRPHKTSPFLKGDFSKKYGILTKEKLVLMYESLK